MKLNRSIICIVIFMTIMSGCAGSGGNSPVTPSDNFEIPALTGNSQPEMNSGGHNLWGFWRGITDKDTGLLEIVPLRGTAFHMNLAGMIVAADPVGMSVDVHSFNPSTRVLECDVTITHPIPDSDFRGFDVRGIFMGPGPLTDSKIDPGIKYNSPDGCRLLNADGYTRWWNAIEFTTSGLSGYDDPRVVPSYLVPNTTLNPYKYFSDPLGPDDEVVPGVNQSNRGTFSTDLPGSSLTRNYQIRFQEYNGAPQLGFHFALDVSWAHPTGSTSSPKPVNDFPPDANMPEAYYVKVDISASHLWYVNEDNNGGFLVLSIEVFDWQAADNPDGIMGEVDSVWVESPTLFASPLECESLPVPGTAQTSGLYTFTLPDVHPTGIENQEVLITVRSTAPTTYQPLNPNAEYPENGKLASYALVELPVAAVQPQNTTLKITDPNGYEMWTAGEDHEIKWIGGADIDQIALTISLDGGLNYLSPITLSTENDGVFIWYSIPEAYTGNQIKIKASEVDNPENFDESDNSFTIFSESDKPIQVISPNGGETWGVDSTIQIKWEAEEYLPNVKITLSKDGGDNFDNEIIDTTPNTGTFEWTIPDWAEGTTNIIRIADPESPAVFDESNDVFTINPPGVVYINPTSPSVGQLVRIGEEFDIVWEWSGNIPEVNVFISIDGGASYDLELAANLENTGLLTVSAEDWFQFDWLFNPANWTQPDLYSRIRVVSSNEPSIYGDSSADFLIPITLGILHQKIDESPDIDSDDDSIPDDCEVFIGSDPDDRDIDRDFFFDYEELFGTDFFGVPNYDPMDLIPANQAGIIACNTIDVNDDGVHDGQCVDTDQDFIPNYLEYYGYTWDWQSGTFSIWDGVDVDTPYYKTDPMQISTDQDPYSDYLETTKANMDVSVRAPGDSPMVPAIPNIEIVMEGYRVTLNSDITTSEGGSETNGTSWETGTENTDTTSMEHGWEFGQEYKVGFSGGSPEASVTTSWKIHGNYGSSSSDTTSFSNGGSTEISEDWSIAISTNPTCAAFIKLYLKVYNTGTAAASNIIPSFTLMIGDRSIATFEQTNAQINHLSPGGIFPQAEGVYWVVDSVDTGTGGVPIALTMDELRSLETGAPVKIVVTQVQAEVMLLMDGEWQSAGNWAEYMGRCEAVCTEVFIDNGEGETKRSLVYSDDSDSAPPVNMRDGLIWAAGGYTPEDGPYAGQPVIPYRKADATIKVLPLDNWHLMMDESTFQDMLAQAAKFDEEHENDPDPPPYNMFDTLLSPESSFTLRAPRPDELDPVIHFATLDEVNQHLIACVTDYSNVDSVRFVDKVGIQYEMTQLGTSSAFWYLDLDGYEASGIDPGDPQLEYLIVWFLFDEDIYQDYACDPSSLGIIYDVSDISPAITGTYFDGNYNTIEAQVSTKGGSPITSVFMVLQGHPSVMLTHQEGDTWFCNMDGLESYGGIYGPHGIELLQVVNGAGNSDVSLVYGSQPLIDKTDSLYQGAEVIRREYNFDYGATEFEYSPGDVQMVLVPVDNPAMPIIKFDPYGACPALRIYKLPDATNKATFDNITKGDFEDLYDLLLNRSQLEFTLSPQSTGTETVGGSMFLIDTGSHFVKLRFTEFIPRDPQNQDSPDRVYFEIVTFAGTPDECLFDDVRFDSTEEILEVGMIPNSPDPVVSCMAMFCDQFGTWSESPLGYQGQDTWQMAVPLHATSETFKYVEVTSGAGYVYQCEPSRVIVPYRIIIDAYRGIENPRWWDFESGTAVNDFAVNSGDFMADHRDCCNNGKDDFRGNLKFAWPENSTTGCNYSNGSGGFSAGMVVFNALSPADIEGISTHSTSGDFNYTFSDECNDNTNIWNGAIFIHKDLPFVTKMIMRSHSYRYIHFDAVTYELDE